MKKFIKMAGVLTVLIPVLLVLAVLFYHLSDSILRGHRIREGIHREIDQSLAITLVEHSLSSDLAPEKSSGYQEKIYRTVSIPESEKNLLKQAFPYGMDTSGIWFTGCFFKPHHRIEMRRPDGSPFILRICFECGELELPGQNKRIMPNGWPESLAAYFSSQSLHPHGPFKNPDSP